MQVKQIAIVAAIASSFAMPLTAQASDIATLNGWGALFAAAHSGQQASAEGQAQAEVQVSLFQAPSQQPPAAQPTPEPTPVAEPAPTPEAGNGEMAEAPAMDAPESGEQTAAADNKAGESAEAGQDGMGKPGKGIPRFEGQIGYFQQLPDGRAFVMQVPGLANGQASLVEGLRATDASGANLPLKDLGEGDYGIAEGIMFGYPLRTKADGSWEIVQGLPIDAFSKEKIAITEKELLEERATASEALGLKL